MPKPGGGGFPWMFVELATRRGHHRNLVFGGRGTGALDDPRPALGSRRRRRPVRDREALDEHVLAHSRQRPQRCGVPGDLRDRQRAVGHQGEGAGRAALPASRAGSRPCGGLRLRRLDPLHREGARPRAGELRGARIPAHQDESRPRLRTRREGRRRPARRGSQGARRRRRRSTSTPTTATTPSRPSAWPEPSRTTTSAGSKSPCWPTTSRAWRRSRRRSRSRSPPASTNTPGTASGT